MASFWDQGCGAWQNWHIAREVSMKLRHLAHCFHRGSSAIDDTLRLTFHFIDASPADALAQAKAAADGKDVRLGGGVQTVREFLDADLVDTLHVAVAPIDLGRGERLWDSPDELLDRYHCDRAPSPSGVTHLLYWRR